MEDADRLLAQGYAVLCLVKFAYQRNQALQNDARAFFQDLRGSLLALPLTDEQLNEFVRVIEEVLEPAQSDREHSGRGTESRIG